MYYIFLLSGNLKKKKRRPKLMVTQVTTIVENLLTHITIAAGKKKPIQNSDGRKYKIEGSPWSPAIMPQLNDNIASKPIA